MNMKLTMKPNNIIIAAIVSSSKHPVKWRVSLDMSQSRKESFCVEKSHGVHLLLQMLTGHVEFGTKIYQNVIQEEMVEDVDQR
jgi:hypothetical protein